MHTFIKKQYEQFRKDLSPTVHSIHFTSIKQKCELKCEPQKIKKSKRQYITTTAIYAIPTRYGLVYNGNGNGNGAPRPFVISSLSVQFIISSECFRSPWP